jgi:hypothetical protein
MRSARIACILSLRKNKLKVMQAFYNPARPPACLTAFPPAVFPLDNPPFRHTPFFKESVKGEIYSQGEIIWRTTVPVRPFGLTSLPSVPKGTPREKGTGGAPENLSSHILPSPGEIDLVERLRTGYRKGNKGKGIACF